jgi:hypothetical protein
MLKQQQLDAGGLGGHDRKVDAVLSAQTGSQGPGATAVDRCDLQSL